MQNEIDSIEKNHMWELTSLPPGHKVINLKLIYKLKKDADENIVKHKSRLVAKGYLQEMGVDFDKKFALVTRLETVRLLLALVVKKFLASTSLGCQNGFSKQGTKRRCLCTQPEGFF